MTKNSVIVNVSAAALVFVLVTSWALFPHERLHNRRLYTSILDGVLRERGKRPITEIVDVPESAFPFAYGQSAFVTRHGGAIIVFIPTFILGGDIRGYIESNTE